MSDSLNIGMVCYPSVGGSGILATQLGQLLARGGHRVHFVSYQKPVRLDLTQPGLFFHQVQLEHHDVFCSPDYTLPLAVKLVEVCQGQHLDLLHVHYAVPHASAALWARSMLRGPGPGLVTTLHGTDVTLMGADPSYHQAISFALQNSDRVTAVSQSLARQTQEQFGVEPMVVANFTSPLPCDRSQVRQRLKLDEQQIVALHASNLRPLKRVDLVLQAFSRSRCDHLLLLGPRGQHPNINADLAQRVTLLDDSESWPYVAACDLGLYASDRESFGLAILETMASGRPVVATEVGGIPEVVGDTGLLADAGDADGLTAHLDQLVDQPKLRQRLGAEARQRALASFPPERALKAYLRVYREALADRP